VNTQSFFLASQVSSFCHLAFAVIAAWEKVLERMAESKLSKVCVRVGKYQPMDA